MLLPNARTLRLPLSLTLWLTVLAAFSGAARAEDSGKPLDLDIEEHVDVQFVLIDAIVHDRRNATVGGLGIEDFELLVDNRDVEIASLDLDCPSGGAADPPVGARRPESVADPGEEVRRYIFVMDYYHPGAPQIEVLEQIGLAVERLHVPGEEYMLISLGQVLRIEVPFTDDADQFARGLERMIYDRGLYAGFYERLTERRWYERILTLLDLTELIPGHKSVVLFSGPFLEDGWTYDDTYSEIAAMAGRSRTAFYPVDSGGLLLTGGILGPRQLGRLAVETGGRATAGTNDLGRAFARAQRDQDCRYTVGFYDHEPRLDRQRRVRLFVRLPGHRVSHPTFYVVRSDEMKFASQVRAASMVPSMFTGRGLSADLVTLAPRSRSRWSALAKVGLDPRILDAAPPDAEWTVKGTLCRMNGTVHQKFRRTFTLSAEERRTEGADLSIVAEIRPRPGRYRLNVVLSNPSAGMPLATTREVVLPRIPKGQGRHLDPGGLEHAHVVGSAHQLLAAAE